MVIPKTEKQMLVAYKSRLSFSRSDLYEVQLESDLVKSTVLSECRRVVMCVLSGYITS